MQEEYEDIKNYTKKPSKLNYLEIAYFMFRI